MRSEAKYDPDLQNGWLFYLVKGLTESSRTLLVSLAKIVESHIDHGVRFFELFAFQLTVTNGGRDGQLHALRSITDSQYRRRMRLQHGDDQKKTPKVNKMEWRDDPFPPCRCVKFEFLFGCYLLGTRRNNHAGTPANNFFFCLRIRGKGWRRTFVLASEKRCQATKREARGGIYLVASFANPHPDKQRSQTTSTVIIPQACLGLS
jgi:hypothetical protein